jgi:propanediol dehydratase small subunit
MTLQDKYMTQLLSGEVKKDDIRSAVALMRCQIQLANLGLRQAKLANRIEPQSDYIPEVYFTKGASEVAKTAKGVRVDKEFLLSIKEAEETAKDEREE